MSQVVPPAEVPAVLAKAYGRRSKYNAVRTYDANGVVWDSRAEQRRGQELVLLVQSGAISGLQRQVRYALDVNGAHICDYVADFVYVRDEELVVEDVKSAPTRTPTYRLKARLMCAVHGITITEIEA